MILQNATKNTNQSITRIENYYFQNEKFYNHETLTERWSLYTDIFNQINILDKGYYFYEIEYRIINEDNSINRVLLDIIRRDEDMDQLLYSFKSVLEDFADLDDIKIFL
jgi:hypothetical protein